MNLASIKAALEKRLLSMTPALSTAYENVPFTPVTGTPYQRVDHLLNTPHVRTLGGEASLFQGIFQVTLFYPMGNGRGVADARANQISQHFPHMLVLTEAGQDLMLERPADIRQGSPDDDRWMVPVRIYWRALS